MKTLIVLAHPNYGASVSNKALLEAFKEGEVIVHDLGAAFKDGKFDVAAEQKLLEAHDRVIFQYPTYWFNVPTLLKQYLDEVFAHGCAYGGGGEALKGKEFAVVTTVGQPVTNYCKEILGFTIEEIVLPMKATISYVKGKFIGLVCLGRDKTLQAFIPDELSRAKEAYRRLAL